MTPALGPVHWLVILISLAIFAIPAAVILKRAGYPAVWILLAIVPGVAIVGLWLFAFARWPVLVDPDAPPPAPKKRWGPA